MPSVTFRLPPSLHERFLAHCEAKDVRPSEFLRQAIETFLDRVDDASLGHHGPKARDINPDIVVTPKEDLRAPARGPTERQLARLGVKPASSLGLQLGPSRQAPGSRLKVKGAK